MENKKIYQILNGSEENFYYSASLPSITEEHIEIINPFEKLKHSCFIGEKEIFVEYTDAANAKSEETPIVVQFDLAVGVIIKSFYAEDLKWLETTFEKAQEEIKEKELDYYRRLFNSKTKEVVRQRPVGPGLRLL